MRKRRRGKSRKKNKALISQPVKLSGHVEEKSKQIKPIVIACQRDKHEKKRSPTAFAFSVYYGLMRYSNVFVLFFLRFFFLGGNIGTNLAYCDLWCVW